MTDSLKSVIKKLNNYINKVDENKIKYEITDETNISREIKERDLEFMRIETEFRQFLLESFAD